MYGGGGGVAFGTSFLSLPPHPSSSRESARKAIQVRLFCLNVSLSVDLLQCIQRRDRENENGTLNGEFNNQFTFLVCTDVCLM
mmetsp:Transcript_51749/g.101422  ORF Transcript_51749/g.101422 Transcript_51749/m.101422 type:complete len:83 (-) Transcript_51749:392-640(-)